MDKSSPFSEYTTEDEEDDEGLGCAGPPKPKRSSFVGTPEYVSPEIFTSRGSSRASDLWAIGCIIYQLISGIPPFQSKSEYMIFKKIEKLDYSFHEGFDENAKDLVKRLLVIEPKERLGKIVLTYYVVRKIQLRSEFWIRFFCHRTELGSRS